MSSEPDPPIERQLVRGLLAFGMCVGLIGAAFGPDFLFGMLSPEARIIVGGAFSVGCAIALWMIPRTRQ